MPLRDLAITADQGSRVAERGAQWRRVLLCMGVAWLFLAILFHAEWTEMASQWWGSSTYNHILFIPLICIWLVAMRAGELAKLDPQAWWPGLVLAGVALLVWLIGAVAQINTGRQLGAVLVMQAVVVALAGPRVAVGLAFPLFYMLFLVPFGDEVVPEMQTFTAKIAIALVLASGVPAHIDGVFIDTPAGLFQVAQACAGVKFLVAMVALGALMAHLCFRDWRRRALFMLAAVIVPVAANGIRAWGTIFLAQHFGAEAATGFDHVVYGWIFFGVVMAMLALAARPYFDRAADDAFVDASYLASRPWLPAGERHPAAPLRVAAVLMVMALSANAWAVEATRPLAIGSSHLALPPVPQWQQVHRTDTIPWQPTASGAQRKRLVHFSDRKGREVDIFVAQYLSQGHGAEAGAQGDGAIPSGSRWSWIGTTSGAQGGRAEYLIANGERRLAVTYYRTGDVLTGSRLRLKLELVRQRLSLAPKPVMVLILSARDGKGGPAAESINALLGATGPLGPWLDRMTESP